MTWSYDPSLPSNRDRVRFYVRDTDANDQLVSDEELDILITDNGSNVYRSAAAAARSIALKVGRRPSVTGLTAGIDAHQQYLHYMEIAKELDAKATTGSGGSNGNARGVFAGGISKADKDARELDADRVTPAFGTALHES